MKTAVLVVDVQTALCSGKYQVFEAERVIDTLNKLTPQAREAGMLVIFVQHESTGGPLDYGSDGWQLAARLNALPNDTYLRKTASDSFHKTQLQAVLQSNNIEHLIIGGMQSDFCVDSTVRRALALGFSVTLIADGHSTLDNTVLRAEQIVAHHNDTLSNLKSYGPRATALKAADIQFSSR